MPSYEIKSNFLTFPTLLTFGRLFLTIPLVGSIMRAQWLWAACLFILAAVTDILDGILARLWRQQTAFGRHLDPLVDKILLVSCFLAFLVRQPPVSFIPFWFVVAVTLKEVVLIGGAIYFGIMQRHVIIKPLFWGKVGGIIQQLFLFILLAASALCSTPLLFFQPLFFLVCICMILSCIYYCSLVMRKVLV